MTKVRYEVDPHNRLILRKTGKKSRVSKYRHLADGRFKIGRKNSLTYHIKKSKDFKTPQQIKFSGNWSLDKRHNLVLTLNKWGNQVAGNKLIIKGKITDIKKNSLLFTVTTKTADRRRQIYILKLSGSCQADAENGFTFDVERQRGRPDTLALKGVWEVNGLGRLIYTYTAKKKTRSLVFEGRWNARDRHRLSYILGRKTITIGGRWKIDEKKGLIFEVQYKKGRTHAIVFGATLKLSKRNSLEVRLRSERGRDLGAKLVLSRRLLKGCGEAFLKILASGKRATLSTGTGFIW